MNTFNEHYHFGNDDNINYNYHNDCTHNRIDTFDGFLTCVECGLILNNLPIRAYEIGDIDYYCLKPLINKEKISAKEKKYNIKMKKMFPDLSFPQGNVLMKDIEKRFKLKKEPGDRFPAIKNIIHFILTKHEMTDLAKKITLPKGNKFQNLMERIFKEDIPTSDDEPSDFDTFKKLYKILEKSSKD